MRWPDRTANTRSSYRARRTQHDDVLAQLKAKPLRGGPKGAGLDLICARHPAQPAVGTKRWPQSNKKVTAHP